MQRRKHAVHRHRHLLLALLTMLALLLSFIPLGNLTPVAQAAASLTIEPMAAYNFVVDSNVLSPSTYAPEAGTLAAKVCNTGTTAAENIVTNIGNFAANTPGIYPVRSHTGLVGTFSLTHEGGSAGLRDAARFLPRLEPGQCAMQYWLVSYPRTAISDGTVFGTNGSRVSVTLSVKPNDDLFLFYDMWATSSNASTVNVTRRVTMRNEISASANKIWPNTDSKVPEAYKAAIDEVLGWNTITPSGGTVAYPGQTVTTQGIWYDLGNVGFGFDNNGDGIPDQNAWVQPIGDPKIYDPGCFRLVRSYGIIIVKLKGGGEQLIPFVDQLYFENIPPNTGVVGLVYYQYAALDGACTAMLSPYQEVASGFDNEKFSGDYGFGIPPLQSREPEVLFTKGVDKNSITTSPTTLLYTIEFTNRAAETGSAAVTVGNPSLGIPLVINDVIPPGTDYLAGTATATGATVSPLGVRVAALRYSTDNGATWLTSEPVPATSVTNLQWWLDAGVPQNDVVTLNFTVTAPVAPPAISTIAVIPNTAEASFGSAPPFAEATVITRVQGNNEISGTIYQDTGTGVGEFANDTLNASESGRFPNVVVSLYLLTPQGRLLWGQITSAAGTGNYSFTGLPDGDYEVEISRADPAITTGWVITGPEQRDVFSLGVAADETRSGINFGFAPPLSLTKNRSSGTPSFEGDLVTFAITATNRLPGPGNAILTQCSYDAWSSAESPWTLGQSAQSSFINPGNFVGEPNNSYATSSFQNNEDRASGGAYSLTGQGVITRVEALFPLYLSAPFGGGSPDSLRLDYFYGTPSTNTSAAQTFPVPIATSNSFSSGPANKGELTWNITSFRGSWTFADLANLHLRLAAIKNGGPDGAVLYLDAIGIRVTTDALCGDINEEITMDPVPLVDTYNANLLSYVSSTLPPQTATVSSGIGTLTWPNVGPLYPGGSRVITVTFRALQPTPTNPITTTNFVTVTGATMVSGRPVNGANASATATISGTGSISGVVWSNPNNNWNTLTNGPDAGEPGIPGVQVLLFACQVSGANYNPTFPLGNTERNRTCAQASGGNWVNVMTQTTSITGSYHFTALRPGFYYVQVTGATIPGGVTNNAEADTVGGDQNGPPKAGVGVGNGIWGLASNNLTDGNGALINFNFLSVDEDITNISFGYPIAPVIFGNVWQDYNGNGAREGTDGGIGSVTVRLCTVTPCTSGGVTTTTDASGSYRFTGLTAGTTYYVSVVTSSLPAGTAPNTITWTQTAESDTTITNEITIPTIASGAVSGSHDFGFTRRGVFTVGDTLYYDWDGDASQDMASEPGIPGVTVRLFQDVNNDGLIDSRDPLISTTVTLNNGTYQFPNLTNGTYYVVVDRSTLPGGILPTQDPDETGRCVVCNSIGRVVVNNANRLDQDFGYLPEGTLRIGDTVWFDRNGDGVQAGVQETGLGGVTVNLQVWNPATSSYITVRTTSTDAHGKYLFDTLPAGTYRVVVDTTDPSIPADAFGNRYAPTTPVSRDITLINADNLTADFGFTALAAIGDTVYYDANRNGDQDFGEPGVPGVTVRLTNASPYTDTTGVLRPAGYLLLSTTTITDGKYLFSGLPAISPTGGVSYTVTVENTTGGLAGRPQTADPDRDGAACGVNINAPGPDPYTACDHATTQRLFPGSNFMGADFGYQPTGVLGDTLWIDADGDGIRDPEEYGIPYVTVRITGPGCAPCTTETDPNGEYRFVGLADGTYTVAVDTADPDFTPLVAQGLVPRFDPDGTLDHQTSVVMSGGVVTNVGGTTCTNCDMNADVGYRFFNASGFAISGTICVDGMVTTGLCGTGESGVDIAGGEAPFAGRTVYLYRWNDANTNSTRDSGEVVLAAVTITDANGDYSFTNLPQATGNQRYIVALAAPGSNLSLTTTSTTPGAGSTVMPTNSGGTNVSALRIFNLDANRTNQDFAYVSTLSFDYGDAPASYGVALSGTPAGPRHQIPTGGSTVYLGTVPPDAEPNGIAATLNGAAVSDDNDDAINDEDGVRLTQIWSNGVNGGTVQVTVTGPAGSTVWLTGWVDFNNDGSFGGGDEQIVNRAVTIPIGQTSVTATYTFDTPTNLFPVGGTSNISLYARFRVFTEQPLLSALAFVGDTVNGEVEDYQFNFAPTAVTLIDFTAIWLEQGVQLAWATASEMDTAGFQLWRATSPNRAEATLITPKLIETKDDSLTGGNYTFDDLSTEAGASYFYWLEEVRSDGSSEFFGPVTPRTLTPTPNGLHRVYLPLTVR